MSDRELGGLGVAVAAGLAGGFVMVFGQGTPVPILIVGCLFTVGVAAAAVAFVSRKP